MAKTSSYRVKTIPKLFVPPFSMAKTFSAPPPPFCRGETSRAPPPSHFVAPPPPWISDQSLTIAPHLYGGLLGQQQHTYMPPHASPLYTNMQPPESSHPIESNDIRHWASCMTNMWNLFIPKSYFHTNYTYGTIFNHNSYLDVNILETRFSFSHLLSRSYVYWPKGIISCIDGRFFCRENCTSAAPTFVSMLVRLSKDKLCCTSHCPRWWTCGRVVRVALCCELLKDLIFGERHENT